MSRTIAVIGAGSWGTALAIHAHECGHQVRLWVHSPDTLRALQKDRVNEIYLPGFPLADEIEITSDERCVVNADYSMLVVPSVHFRSTFARFQPHWKQGAALISCIKGMEPETSKRISEIVQEMSGDRFLFSVLSGPSFAKEVAQHNPTAVVIGSENRELGKQIQNDLRSHYFRLYYNPDVLGIEVGGEHQKYYCDCGRRCQWTRLWLQYTVWPDHARAGRAKSFGGEARSQSGNAFGFGRAWRFDFNVHRTCSAGTVRWVWSWAGEKRLRKSPAT